MASWGERLTRIGAEKTDAKRVVVVVVVVAAQPDTTLFLSFSRPTSGVPCLDSDDVVFRGRFILLDIVGAGISFIELMKPTRYWIWQKCVCVIHDGNYFEK